MMKRRFFATASGSVQGVGFRIFVQMHALENHVTGWVRNMPDGTVTMEIQGEEASLDALQKSIMQGAWLIRVEELTLEERVLLEHEDGFVIR